MRARFAAIGIEAGRPFDPATSTPMCAAMRAWVDQARAQIAARSEHLGESINGWSVFEAFGSRNFFGGDFLLRAAGVMVGSGGNDKVDAVYPFGRVDGDGAPLSGDHRYRLRLETAPPAKAFWSVPLGRMAG